MWMVSPTTKPRKPWAAPLPPPSPCTSARGRPCGTHWWGCWAWRNRDGVPTGDRVAPEPSWRRADGGAGPTGAGPPHPLSTVRVGGGKPPPERGRVAGEQAGGATAGRVPRAGAGGTPAGAPHRGRAAAGAGEAQEPRARAGGAGPRPGGGWRWIGRRSWHYGRDDSRRWSIPASVWCTA